MVPAGMGVIYTKQPIADAAALEAGYTALLNAAPGQRSTNVDGLSSPPESDAATMDAGTDAASDESGPESNETDEPRPTEVDEVAREPED